MDGLGGRARGMHVAHVPERLLQYVARHTPRRTDDDTALGGAGDVGSEVPAA
jgi:hypothetical protein